MAYLTIIAEAANKHVSADILAASICNPEVVGPNVGTSPGSAVKAV